jgi:hypothetical protein
MFNKTYHTDNSVNFPDEVRIVHEHPTTPEQIKLLREMEGDLRKDILSHVRIDNNDVKFNCFLRHKYFDDFELVAVLKLNNKELTIKHEFNLSERKSFKEQTQMFFRKIADQIVLEVLAANYQEVEKVLKALRLDSY